MTEVHNALEKYEESTELKECNKHTESRECDEPASYSRRDRNYFNPTNFKSRIKLRHGYTRPREKSQGVDRLYTSDSYDKIIEIRSVWLSQEHPEIGNNFLKRKMSALTKLDRLAEKYVHDDYMISPRVGRRIVFAALQRLIPESELVCVDPDPLIITAMKGKRQGKTEEGLEGVMVA